MNGAGLQRLCDHPLIAEGSQQDLVALGIQADLFESEHCRHPPGAADAGNADSLAAQIGGSLDLRPHPQIGLNMIGKSSDHFNVQAAHRGSQGRCTAGIAKMHITGTERRDQSR